MTEIRVTREQAYQKKSSDTFITQSTMENGPLQCSASNKKVISSVFLDHCQNNPAGAAGVYAPVSYNPWLILPLSHLYAIVAYELDITLRIIPKFRYWKQGSLHTFHTSFYLDISFCSQGLVCWNLWFQFGFTCIFPSSGWPCYVTINH